jgi:hypothetical protein
MERLLLYGTALLSREKYKLEKFVISLHVNASTIHPSTLALLWTVYLSFLILFLDYTSTWTAQVLHVGATLVSLA